MRQEGEKRAGRVAWRSYPTRGGTAMVRRGARWIGDRVDPFRRLAGRNRGGLHTEESVHPLVHEKDRVAIVAVR